MLSELKKDLLIMADPIRAKNCLRFFKTGKGEYGAGDKFIGVSNPDQRKIAKKYKNLRIGDLQKLLSDKIHEHRQVALYILVDQFARSKNNEFARKKIVKLYLKNTKKINNWDLVDCSAHHVLGSYLLDKKDRKILYKLAKSKNLWERRISIIATFLFIRTNDFKDAIKIAEILLNDSHDLIHKAVGWMLREVGNRDLKVEEDFLKKYYKKMPRVMLRYAIEKFNKKSKQFYMKK
ncbi:MAG: DNA alkylation repair protein [bacterium]